ncbi:hypothetical protein BGZ46_006209 [Entomortierella lignicola]|nr:hypothetical protein BGZ46_006209 [Entomortierella lignicola]
MEGFPPGEFKIQLRYTDLVFDVREGSKDEGADIILWTERDDDDENQKWIHEDGQLRNKKSGLVLTATELGANKIVNQRRSSSPDTQRYEFYDYTISAEAEDSLVLGINGAKVNGAPIALIPRDDDSDSQQWEIIPV